MADMKLKLSRSSTRDDGVSKNVEKHEVKSVKAEDNNLHLYTD